MADKRLMPDGIRGASTEGFNELIDRLGSLDITPLLVNMIDNVHASALPHLAEQFHVMGAEGWEMARTEAEKRSIIRRAIELHRRKGTPWAVKEAIRSVGYRDVTLEERLPHVTYSGGAGYSGSEDYGSGVRWALFKALIDLGESKSLSLSEIEGLKALITEHKNARSHLKEIAFKASVIDALDALLDTLRSGVTSLYEEVTPWGQRYDGGISHNQGERRTYGGTLAHNGEAVYREWLTTGKGYDNERDMLDSCMRTESADEARCWPLHDGRLFYSGFGYGSDAPLAVEPAMPVLVTRHIWHDGRHTHGGTIHDGLSAYSGAKRYFEGIYHDNIRTTEAVI